MDHEALLRRAEDLARQSWTKNIVTHTGFLTPAEQAALQRTPPTGDAIVFHGGIPDCERQIAFFLPDYLSKEDLEPTSYIAAFHGRARFQQPGHRDYLGALLGLGIERWCLGDIYTQGEDAWFFCLSSVAAHIARDLDKVGRGGVQLSEIPPQQVPAPERAVKPVSFTVKSLRLDAVLAGAFSLSRGPAAQHISAGSVQLNHTVVTKPDLAVGEGDMLSLRGHGRAKLAAVGGTSKKGRLYITAERYL